MSLAPLILTLPLFALLTPAPADNVAYDPLDTPEHAMPIGPREGPYAQSKPIPGVDEIDGPTHPFGLGDKILYVNFDGGQMSACNSGPQNNCSSLFFGTVLPYSGDAARRAAIVQILRTRLGDFGVTTTDTRPGSGDYDMEMVGNWSGVDNPGFAGVAPGPLDCFDNRGGEVSFTLEASGTSDGIAEIVLQEIAHTWGLEHIDDQGDLLYPTTEGQNKIFKDECLQIVVLNENGSVSPTGASCNQQHTMFCNSNNQNSYRELLMLFGPAVPDTIAPTVEILEPADGATIGGDVNLRVLFEDNQSPVIINATIIIDSPALDAPVEQDGAYAGPSELEFPINGLPAGEYTVTIEAQDEDDNPAGDMVTFTVTGEETPDTGADDTGGDPGTGGTGSDPSDSETASGSNATSPDDDGGNGDGGVEGGDTDGVGADDGDDGCGCTTDTPRNAGWMGFGLLGLLFVRRRRAA